MLTSGENEIQIEVSSTLFNAVKERLRDLRSLNMPAKVPKYYTQVQWAEFGLLGEVFLRGFRTVIIA